MTYRQACEARRLCYRHWRRPTDQNQPATLFSRGPRQNQRIHRQRRKAWHNPRVIHCDLPVSRQQVQGSEVPETARKTYQCEVGICVVLCNAIECSIILHLACWRAGWRSRVTLRHRARKRLFQLSNVSTDDSTEF